MIVKHPTSDILLSYKPLIQQCKIFRQSMEQFADSVLEDCIKQLSEIENYLQLLQEDDEAFDNNPLNYVETYYGELPPSNNPAA